MALERWSAQVHCVALGLDAALGESAGLEFGVALGLQVAQGNRDAWNCGIVPGLGIALGLRGALGRIDHRVARSRAATGGRSSDWSNHRSSSDQARLTRAPAPCTARSTMGVTESRRATWLALAALVVLCTVSLIWLLPGFYDPTISTGDGAVYIVTARSLLEGHGYSYLGEPFTIRPPGFSVLLVPLIALFGVDYVALAWCIGLSGVVAVALLFLYARTRLGLPLAFAVALALWLNPGFLRSCSQIMSDIPGLALMFGALLLERWARKPREGASDLGANLLLGLFIGLAAYVRSLNIFVAPALVCGRVCAAWRDGLGERSLANFVLVRLVLPVAVAFGALLPWNLYAGSVEQRVPPDHTLFYSYSVAMWQQDMADPGSPKLTGDQLLQRVHERTGDVMHVLGSRITERDDDDIHRAIALIALGIWVIVLGKRRGTGDFLTGGIVLILSIYFGFMNRLILPLYALVLIAVAQAFLWSLATAVGKRKAAWITTALVLALAAVDFQPTWRWDQARVRSDLFFKTCRVAERRFDEGDVLAADFGAHFSAELDRPVYTLRWSLKRGGVPGGLDFIERYHVTSLILDRTVPNNRQLLERLEQQGAATVAEIGPYALVELE